MSELDSPQGTDTEPVRPGYRVPLGLAVALMAIAFGAGFAARSPQAVQPPLVPDPGTVQRAPALDDGQLRGGLPSGHPPIDGSGSPVPVPTATATAVTTGP